MLGNALQMRNAGLQSNIFYLQSIHFTLLPIPQHFQGGCPNLFLDNIFHLSASLVLRYNLLFVCLFVFVRKSEVSFVRFFSL